MRITILKNVLFSVIIGLVVVINVTAQNTKVACVGNSITFGAGIKERSINSYPSQLQELLGDSYEVGTFGFSGATMLKKGHKPYWTKKVFKQSQQLKQGWTLSTPNSKVSKTALIPYPQNIEWSKENSIINTVKLSVNFESNTIERKKMVDEVNDILKESGVSIVDKETTGHTQIVIEKTEVANPQNTNEAYYLKVDGLQILLRANSKHGIFNGLQTLRQLIYKKDNDLYAAGCEITDWPVFKVRGIMLDVGRNFMSVEFIKRHIKKLSRYKINTLHLHLTDDPAWRLQSKSYPELTKAEHHWKSRQPGMFYSYKDIHEIISFCSKRFIEVIPEIDMPGHSKSFERALGTDMQTEKGITYLKNILDEAIPLFPSKYFHIGSDEVRVRNRLFMNTMVDHIRKKGKEVIVWHPGLIPDKDVTVMCWGQHQGYKVKPEMKHIDTNGFYMDWIDSQSGVYQFFFQQPCDTASGNQNALGAITPIWTDGALSHENRVIEQYPFYPCAITFSERIWRGAKEKRKDLMAQLPQKGTPAWEAFNEFENRLVTHRDLYFKSEPFAYVTQSEIQWKLIGPFNHQGKNDTSFEPENIIKPKYEHNKGWMEWKKQPAWGGAIHIRHFYDVFNNHKNKYFINHWPASMTDRVGKNDGTCYALTYVKSPEEQEVYLMFGLNGMWGHTGGYRSARAPEQGQWDFSGGDIWLNDTRIKPPKWPFKSLPWTGWGKGRIEDAPLTQEGYFFRPPVKVSLKKGWNKILIRSVFGNWKGDKGQRKWFFNCVPVTYDGMHYREVKNLTYSSSMKK